jgi:hypothetical protein
MEFTDRETRLWRFLRSLDKYTKLTPDGIQALGIILNLMGASSERIRIIRVLADPNAIKALMESVRYRDMALAARLTRPRLDVLLVQRAALSRILERHERSLAQIVQEVAEVAVSECEPSLCGGA